MSEIGAMVRFVPSPDNKRGGELRYCVQSCSFDANDSWKNVGVISFAKPGNVLWLPLPEFEERFPTIDAVEGEVFRHEGRRLLVPHARAKIRALAETIQSGEVKEVNRVIPQAFEIVGLRVDQPVFSL